MQIYFKSLLLVLFKINLYILGALLNNRKVYMECSNPSCLNQFKIGDVNVMLNPTRLNKCGLFLQIISLNGLLIDKIRGDIYVN